MACFGVVGGCAPSRQPPVRCVLNEVILGSVQYSPLPPTCQIGPCRVPVCLPTVGLLTPDSICHVCGVQIMCAATTLPSYFPPHTSSYVLFVLGLLFGEKQCVSFCFVEADSCIFILFLYLFLQTLSGGVMGWHDMEGLYKCVQWLGKPIFYA